MVQLPPLPPSTYADPKSGTEITEEQLKRARPEDQIKIIKYWFFQCFENPVNDTPWDNESGTYFFLKGGPFDAAEELYEQFSDFVTEGTIQQAAKEIEVENECVEWTHTDAYRMAKYPDEFYEIDAALDEKIPIDAVYIRLSKLKDLLNQKDAMTPDVHSFQRMMIFSFCVTTLECYLSDVFVKAVLSDQKYKERYLKANADLGGKKITIADIHQTYGSIDNLIKSELGKTTFHHLERLAGMYKVVLGVEFGDIGDLIKYIRKRHDFVHRAGNDTDGNPVTTTVEEITKLIECIEKFCRHVGGQHQF